MSTTTPHPDTLTDWQSFKEIQRGGRQTADTAAMEAMWQALNEGKGKEEAGKIFSQTYQLFIHILPDQTADEMKDAEFEAIINLETY